MPIYATWFICCLVHHVAGPGIMGTRPQDWKLNAAARRGGVAGGWANGSCLSMRVAFPQNGEISMAFCMDFSWIFHGF